MGKGNRNSQQRLDDKVANAERNLEKQRRNNKKKRSDKVIAAVCVAFAILVVAVLVLNVLSETGVFLRGTHVVECEGIVVDATMMNFFFNDYLVNWYNSNYTYANYYSLDLTKSLKNQQYGTGMESYFFGSFDGTWYEFFLDGVLEQVDMYVTYASAAKKAGMEISEEDRESIDDVIADLKKSVKEAGASLSDWYGKGVGETDIRRCYELMYLAATYEDSLISDIKETLDADDSPVYSFVEKNKGDFYTADYLSYKIKLSSKNFASDEAYDSAVKIARDEANKIAAAATPQQFIELIEKYEELDPFGNNEKETGTEASTATESETLSPEEEMESKIEDYKTTIKYEETEKESDTRSELGEWIFGDDAASEGENKVIEETGIEKETSSERSTEGATESETDAPKMYDTYTVTVYHLTKSSSLDESLTKDMAYLIADSKDEALAFIASFNASEKKNCETFVEIADAQYDKIHEGHDHSDTDAKDPVFSYTSVEKAPDNYFSANYGAINDWLDSGLLADNTLSDVIEFKVDKTTYYAVVFFQNYEEKAYYVNAYNGLVNERVDEWYKGEIQKNLIKYNEDALENINTIILY